jgi:riboflavin kinase/FMN adenylyltransferase
MRIFRHCTGLASTARRAVVAIGNFDGVHRGHQAVIGEAVRLARAAGANSAVLTFEPHPRRFFRPDAPPFLLTRFRTKVQVIAELGVELMFLLRFNAALARLNAETFIDDVLLGGLDAAHVVIGYDFVFGHQRRGSPELLRERLRAHGRDATIMPPVTGQGASGVSVAEADTEGSIISSTGVRDCLVGGDPRGAARLLGRGFEIEGRVTVGDRRGRALGFPTANLRLDDYLRPKFGVYAIRAGLAEGERTIWHDGVANLGLRPMFGAAEPLLEAYLFDFSGDLYGRHLRVSLVDYLRPEAVFDTLDALKAQMTKDCAAARQALARPAAPPANQLRL